MNIRLVAVAAAALATGAAIGWFVKPSSIPAAGASQDGAKAKKIAEPQATDSEKALRARIKELELALASKSRPMKTAAVKVAETRPESRRGTGDRDFGRRLREDLERMKKDEPERFAALTNRIARDDRRRAERTMGKLGFLASIDTSRMTPEGKAVHAKLQDLMVHREEIEQRRLSVHDMEETERRRYFEDMHRTDREIRELSFKERDNLLRQTADALGFSGSAADEIVETVKEIYEATETGFGRMPPRRRGGTMRRNDVERAR